MKVVLLQKVEKLGNAGEIKKVSAGFASNFLIPKKLAKPASEKIIKEVEKQLAGKKVKDQQALESHRKEAKELEGQEFLIEKKAKDGKLFGSVKEKDLAIVLQEKGFEIEESSIQFEKVVKELGEFQVVINFKAEIKAKIKLVITEKK